MLTKFTWVPCFAVLAVCMGCGTVPDYDVSIKNSGTFVFDHANLRYGSFESGDGIIVPGTYKGYGHVDHPIPDEAVVEWTRDSVPPFSKRVDMRRVPKDFTGEIRFEIDDNNRVKVRLIPRK